MIHRTEPVWQGSPWQKQLAEAYTRTEDLLRFLHLDLAQLPAARAAAAQFALRVPRTYAGLIKKGDASDPLLLQVLPSASELLPADGFTADPVGDGQARQGQGLLHKYRRRALLITTAACAINCRYCFRRHYPYHSETGGSDRWHEALGYLGSSPEITEIILSGGDPLTLSDSRLGYLIDRLGEIGHLQTLRIHSRLPALLPARIDDLLIEMLNDSRLQTVLVLHINHPREITPPLATALSRLHQTGATLLNQSVLLRGVNDSAEVLCELSEALFSVKVLPYYLHQLDRVQGAAHFEIPDSEALSLHRRLRQQLPGYLVPRLVRDRPGVDHKSLLGMAEE